MIEICKSGDIRHKYDDIINLEHHVSSIHRPMSIMNRAAQFAPFAALTGYGDEIKEASRIVDNKIDISDDLKDKINNKLLIIERMIRPYIMVTYFVKDKKKDGGEYITISNIVKRIDLYNGEMVFTDKTKILINDIVDIEIKKAND